MILGMTWGFQFAIYLGAACYGAVLMIATVLNRFAGTPLPPWDRSGSNESEESNESTESI